MNTDMILSAFSPKSMRKNDAARIRPESTISAFGTVAKYATFTRIYNTDTDITPNGAAMDNVRTGLRVSLRAWRRQHPSKDNTRKDKLT